MPVSIGLLPIYNIDPSQHNDTSVRSSVRTMEGLDSYGYGSSQTLKCISDRSEQISQILRQITGGNYGDREKAARNRETSSQSGRNKGSIYSAGSSCIS